MVNRQDAPEPGLVRAWDPLVRTSHWALAAVFAVAYVGAEASIPVHAVAGYAIGALLAVRILWGLVGPRHARFSDFAYPPRSTMAYLKALLTGKPRRYLGHSPAGGAMVFALLITLAIAVLTGVASYGAEEQAGPFAAMLAHANLSLRGTLGEVHGFFANATVLLVVLHIGAWHSRAMCTGKTS